MWFVLTVAILAALVAWAVVWNLRWHRTPVELRGDWWSSFEAEFRAYARRSDATSRLREHRPDSGPASG